MTVPAQVLAAVRSIPHPRQEPDMTAPHPSPAEQAVIDRFEAAPAAPESFDAIAALRRVEALADELDREGVVMLFHGPHNRNQFITARIRAAIAAPR